MLFKEILCFSNIFKKNYILYFYIFDYTLYGFFTILSFEEYAGIFFD